MTNVDDALQACRLGVDAIGLIFHQDSPRNVTAAQAQEIVKQLPPFVSKVGVFVDKSAEFVTNILKMVPLDLLQFHGHEEASYCRSFDTPYIKVIKVAAEPITKEIEKHYPNAAGFLFDTEHTTLQGGSGVSFDWNNLPQDLSKPLILAGGLTTDNLMLALSQVRPYAIDVTSGIERTKGVKDLEKMKFFVSTVMDYNTRSNLKNR